MLKEADVLKIQTEYKIPGLVDAWKDAAEKDVTIPEGRTVLEDKELTTLKATEYNNGKTAGLEMGVKDYAKDNNIVFTGKTLEGLVKAASDAAVKAAGVDPGEQVKQLNTELENIRKNYSELEGKVQEKEGVAAKATTRASIYGELPTLGETAVPMPKVLQLMESDGYDFKNENGKIIAYLNGEKVVDKVSQAVPLKDVISGYAKENKLVSAAPADPKIKGRGGDDGKEKVVFTKLSELKEHFKNNDKHIQGKEFADTLKQIRKDNPEFDMTT